eukprot:TRINITY_DN2734_c0_g1_i2.p2 TRINITY_DN2734_c0_g1~~TRINITY_DN2734_c0_g1_i2.p2  ORF type:complete len:398 (-),score=85.58 TRINITY_DN2734_c0_g1_i2:40-1107(-)
MAANTTSSGSAIKRVFALSMPFATQDPFLFCVYHKDAYPKGQENLGVDTALLRGRNIGSDFSGKDGWSMYHGEEVPGFPAHPHRGFETITVVRSGLCDHSDSLGATARFGEGDAQWLTAGSGIVHAEMFPLVHRERGNPLELFQIWLNLPRAKKMSKPHFSMLWGPTIPVFKVGGGGVQIATVAGQLPACAEYPAPSKPPAPPPDSWAAQSETDVAVWTIRLEAKAVWTLPAAAGGAGVNRSLYFFRGAGVTVGGRALSEHVGLELRAEAEVEIRAGAEGEVELLLLQGRPIGEPVAQRGPFVMNEQAELVQTYRDYMMTRFGGWSFETEAPVHPRSAQRFAKHADGRTEYPEAA